uniref:Transcriptional regulator n=1 Tax=Schistosoma curassoni TaxID=6186 RepID=A0A183JT74_9TREM
MHIKHISDNRAQDMFKTKSITTLHLKLLLEKNGTCQVTIIRSTLGSLSKGESLYLQKTYYCCY